LFTGSMSSQREEELTRVAARRSNLQLHRSRDGDRELTCTARDRVGELSRKRAAIEQLRVKNAVATFNRKG